MPHDKVFAAALIESIVQKSALNHANCQVIEDMKPSFLGPQGYPPGDEMSSVMAALTVLTLANSEHKIVEGRFMMCGMR